MWLKRFLAVLSVVSFVAIAAPAAHADPVSKLVLIVKTLETAVDQGQCFTAYLLQSTTVPLCLHLP